MTPAEADQRIILSRQTLVRYAEMAAAGQYPTSDIGLIGDEIAILEQIAEVYPIKAAKLESLIERWADFRVRMKGKLN